MPGMKKTIKKYSAKHALSGVLKILPYLSDRNILRILSIAKKASVNPAFRERIIVLEDKIKSGHPTLEIVRRLNKQLSAVPKKKLIANLFANAMFDGTARRQQILKEEGWRPPFFFVLSPTMKCNLKCTGCYAAQYTKQDVITTEQIDRIFNEAKELGIYFVTISGGEPFYRQDLLELWEKHNDMFFLVYTNGTLIDSKLAERLRELGNVAPAISVEGFKKETDERRGPGVYEKLLEAWKCLRENGVLFGFSATCTKYNTEVIYSDDFIDFMIEQGALFGWYFQYIPIGRKPDTSLMATPEQRAWARERLDYIRNTKPIILADFWNDGHLAGGCIAGGRVYFHINAHGNIEPCVFTHFTKDNIRDTTIRQALQSDLFKTIQKHQPYSKNLMCPCMIIDNPEVLRNIVKQTGAKPSYPGAEAIITESAAFLDEYARKIHELWDPVWAEKYEYGKKLKGLDAEVAEKLFSEK
ncbi:MAG: radical SAM protein [Candidatus Omnitrophica bacterium]|nr:radical SAM protein [Candidatus Omnitrophota bacterium]